MKIMLSPAYRRQQHHHQPVSGDGCADEVKEPDAVAVSAGFRDALGGMEIHIGPSACIFWCAIALGALVRGSPIESVSRLLVVGSEGRNRELRLFTESSKHAAVQGTSPLLRSHDNVKATGKRIY